MSQELFEKYYRTELDGTTSAPFIDAMLAKSGADEYINFRVFQNWKLWQAAYQKGLDDGWTEGYHLGQVELASYVIEVKEQAAESKKTAVSVLEDVLRDHAEWNDEDTRENIVLSFSEKLMAVTGE